MSRRDKRRQTPRPWSNKPSDTCYRGHLKTGTKFRKRVVDGDVQIREYKYCKACNAAAMKIENRGHTSVRISRMLYLDVTESAKKHGTKVYSEIARLLVAALARKL